MIQRVVTILAAENASQGKVCKCEQPRAVVPRNIVLVKIGKSTGNDSGGICESGDKLGWYLRTLKG